MSRIGYTIAEYPLIVIRTDLPSEGTGISIEALREMAQHLDDLIREDDVGDPYFANPDYVAYPIAATKMKEIQTVKSDRKMAFIDGGNQEILGAPNFSVQINRVYFCLFNGERRMTRKIPSSRIEFFSATYSTFKNNEVFYNTELYPVGKVSRELLPDHKDLSFSSTDRSVTVGNQRADISRVASIARRFAEWKFAAHVAEEELGAGDVLVMDGSLESAFTNEPKYLRQVFEVGKSKKVTVTGLSKTSRLFTTTGLSLLGAVMQIAEGCPHTKWYIPLAVSNSLNHEAAIFAVKLHQSSERIFRYEIQREQFKDLGDDGVREVMGLLAQNARDITFPGYPYGLVDADAFGRVRDEEVAHYRALLMSEISKMGKWKKFARHLRCVDAHDYLNTVVG